MDFSNILSKTNPHQRTIIHLDMDCFYAQVEEIKDQSLRTKPLGVRQKNCVVTCNYIAREYGVTKLMLVSDAEKLCPTLVLVNGEDLTSYRQMSAKIFEILHTFSPVVEKLGLDENFIDATALVAKRILDIEKKKEHIDDSAVIGFTYPSSGANLKDCDCGCSIRLAIGTQIAKQIRDELYNKLGVTCCAGISYNKLLAKLVGSQNKPNKQTVLVSTYAEEFMRDLKHLHKITGIGQKTESLLIENGITNVIELQNCNTDFLRKKLGFETATKLKDLSVGCDLSMVRPSGKPKTISLEDSCRPISVKRDVEERFRILLMRLAEQVTEDGRIPIAIKVIIRKFDTQKKTSHRETKQANILPSLFATSNGGHVMLSDDSQDKLLKIIMRLFERIVDMNKPFNITLIGLAFSKFQQKKTGSSSIANYLIKKTDLEVQSITCITNDDVFVSSPTTFQPSDQFYRRRTTASPIPMLTDADSPAASSDFSDVSENEVEPSPKKSRLGILMAKRHCLVGNELGDTASPSKLRVSDLRLNSRDSEKDFSLSPVGIPSAGPTKPGRKLSTGLSCRRESERFANNSESITSPMDEQPMLLTPSTNEIKQLGNSPSISSSVLTPTNASVTNIANLKNIPCPSGVDPNVFNELPLSVQNELIASWRSSLAAAAAAATGNGNVISSAASNTSAATTAAASGQKKTLYHYFLRNK